MRPAEVEIRFYDTYYFANVVKNILSDQLAYIRRLNDFFGDGQHVCFVKPFPRFSGFHAFLEFVIDDLLSETGDIDLPKRQAELVRFRGFPGALLRNPMLLPLNDAFLHYGIDHTSFEMWLQEAGRTFEEASCDDIDEYYSELRLETAYEKLLDIAVNEVFYVTFSNRRLLMDFNEMMSRQIEGTELGDVPNEFLEHFARSGALRRYSIPQWVKDAVYFRDRGRCVFCRCDLSGLISIGSDKNFDHVVPLAQGGLNDVTNIQLLCDSCNSKKSCGDAVTSDFYQAWYSLNEGTQAAR